MDIVQLKKLQDCQATIMDDIHKICEENNIEYYIIGGTALGAVRHKGFIPWDIDIDIAMHRTHYKKFKDVCSTSLPSKYSYTDHTVYDDYYPPHALIVLKNSVLIKKIDYLNPRLRSYGVFIDIFPLDNVPKEKKSQIKQAKDINRIRKLKWYRTALIYPEHSTMKKYAKKLVRIILLPLSMKRMNVKMEKIMQKYNNDENSTNWCSMASQYSYEKQSMPKEVYGTPTLMEFSGRMFYAPEKVSDYLTRIYGDYMKLPSEEERQKSMDYFVDASW
jgi:lipopolysaccharide cholinephosphotransferase